jgi:peptidoglycan pentaglycine glycine transferase (the first glycine)
MNLRLENNLSQKQWDDFVGRNAADGGYLQSWNWGELQASTGRKIFRLAVMSDKKNILAAGLIIKHALPFRRSYLYLPRGPVLSDNSTKEVWQFLLSEIKKLAKAEKAIFVRLDPPLAEDALLVGNDLHNVGQVQPKSTLILDLTLSEEKLLAQMKPKTRYNIKVAEKHGVKIKYSRGENGAFEKFWQMMISTAERDRIKTHSENYYRQMLEVPGFQLALAESAGQVLAGAILYDFGSWRIYLHGASDYEGREKMAPYALQWGMIKSAKSVGLKAYDFFGVDEAKWPGVSRFKIGFASQLPLTVYVGAYDLVINKMFYLVYNLMRKFRS